MVAVDWGYPEKSVGLSREICWAWLALSQSFRDQCGLAGDPLPCLLLKLRVFWPWQEPAFDCLSRWARWMQAAGGALPTPPRPPGGPRGLAESCHLCVNAPSIELHFGVTLVTTGSRLHGAGALPGCQTSPGSLLCSSRVPPPVLSNKTGLSEGTRVAPRSLANAATARGSSAQPQPLCLGLGRALRHPPSWLGCVAAGARPAPSCPVCSVPPCPQQHALSKRRAWPWLRRCSLHDGAVAMTTWQH